MKKMIGVIALLLLVYGGKLLIDAGFFYKSSPLGMETCHSRASLPGAEDMEYSKLWKGAIISSQDRTNGGAVQGALYFLPAQGEPRLLTQNLPFSFHPHGLGIWEEGNELTLFVVNHGGAESVEVFRSSGQEKLQHVKTLRDANLVVLNDIAPIGKDSFYVTQDHGSASHLAQTVEHFSRSGRGGLKFYDGTQFVPVLEHLLFPNGVTYNANTKHLYLAVTLEKRVAVFHAERPGELVFDHDIAVDAGPDNLSLDEAGDLWIGAHPNLFALKNHSENPAALSPVQVLHVKAPAQGGKVELKMAGDGAAISAVSVALPAGPALYLGTIFTNQFWECSRPKTY